MEKKLHLLESFGARGSDGKHYKVMAYEHLVQVTPPVDGLEHWDPTGQIEYRLEDGARVAASADGRMRVESTGVELKPEDRTQPA